MHLIPERYLVYAEDDSEDQEALIEIVSRIDPDMHVTTFDNGLELMQFLQNLPVGEYLPCCVILDMNMPLWDGMRTLQEIKKHKVFQHLPVVIFTTSSAERDQERTLSLGAEAFITKPVHESDFEITARRFSIFCQALPSRKQAHS